MVKPVTILSHVQVSSNEEADNLAKEDRRSSPLCPQLILAHYRTIDSPLPKIKRPRSTPQHPLTPTVCKVLAFDQIVAPTLPFFSALEFHNCMQDLGLSAMVMPPSTSVGTCSAHIGSSSDSNSEGSAVHLRQPLLILPPALKRWGSPRRQGLRSQLAHKCATSDFAPRSEAEGIPKTAGVT